jgi:UDP-N-acetylglucosamine--N-acetylmuramyl-(pentapeptide) pyrophosphoryl-undecaprenol N-acetylglucosamine transferase
VTTVLFAGGGTGGHLMPALAIADAMVRLDPDVRPYFIGATRGVEARILPSRPWPHRLLPLEPLYRRTWWRNVRLPWSVLRSLRGIRAVLRAETPALAVGTGGYASGLAIWAAALRGVPVVLQEQNARPGFATRRLARRARQVHLGFPEARGVLKVGPATAVFDSGNPITPPPGRRPAPADAKRALGFAPDRPLVVVVGGSQGALGVNLAVADALTGGGWPLGVSLLWQTGAATFVRFRGHASAAVRVEAFLDPIAACYAAADLVVCRAGAMTLAEVAAWGLPTVLVPLPTAAADHQRTNARALAAAGAAVLLEQEGLSGAGLAAEVGRLLADPGRRRALSDAVRSRAKPTAAEDIARAALSLLHAT